MSENKTSKYFKYAFGEIILVVFGILIALQINNWNENRKTKNKEHKLLETVLKNVKKDSSVIQFVIGRAEQIENIHKQLILFDQDAMLEDSIENIDYLRRTFSHKFITQTNNPNLSNLVLNDEVKDLVLEYFLGLNITEYKIESYNRIIEDNFRPYLARKSLLNFGNQFDFENKVSDQLVNRKLFINEFKKGSVKQVLFEAGIKVESLRFYIYQLEKINQNLALKIKSYLSDS